MIETDVKRWGGREGGREEEGVACTVRKYGMGPPKRERPTV
jgi:hypothetical protein